MTLHSFVTTQTKKKAKKVCIDNEKFVATMKSLSRQSSKKNVKPHCHDKLASKAEEIEAAYMSRHFITFSRQRLLESNINNCRDKAKTEPDDKEGCYNVATLP